MLDALDITEAEAAGLAELAVLDLAMARHFAARAQAEDDPEVASQLARSYQRAARSYRQTLALKVRLKREIATAAEAGKPQSGLDPRNRFERRADELCLAVSRIAWAEHENAEALGHERDEDVYGRCMERFGRILDRLSGDPRFTRHPLDEQVMEIAHELRLHPTLAARWRNLATPPPDAYAAGDDGEDESVWDAPAEDPG